MPAHPNITANESRQITSYILSLANDDSGKKSLPQEGSITPKPATNEKVMVIRASYTDNGLNGIRPLTGNSSVTLKNKEDK